MLIDLRDAKVLITGGSGFLGQHVCRELDRLGAMSFSAGREYPLDHHPYADILLAKAKPDYVFHLAGYNGGIQFNRDNPADIFYRNTVMGLNVLEACRRFRVKKVVSVVASCAYPHMSWHGECEAEVMEEEGFLGSSPHPSVACHGYAKRNLQLASSYYRKQYGLNAVCACPTTLYGPGDNFDYMRTKVLGALVKRFVNAADNANPTVEPYGTGRPMREFLYVEDAARLLVQTMTHYDDSDLPLNLGSGQEFTIKEVAETIARIVGFTGSIVWDTSMPDGQMRKRLDMSRQAQLLPGVEFTPLEDGIRKTVDYYRGTIRGT